MNRGRPIKRIALCVAALTLAGALVWAKTPWWRLYEPPSAYFPAEVLPQAVTIAHAGGQIDGLTYTNSRQALASAVAAGFKFIELDLLLSADRQIFAAHDWGHFREISGQGPGSEPLPASALAGLKIHGRYEVLLAGDIKAFFDRHPDLYLVTDKIDDFEALLGQLNFDRAPERLLVEVFSYDHYLKALKAGLKYPLLSIGNVGRLKKYMRKIKTGRVKMIALSDQVLQAAPDLVEKARAAGAAIFVFTSNDPRYIKSHWPLRAAGFYSDTVSPAMIFAD